ncbi:MAG: PKD domain-containing protein [Crocinitomicaceae bacterium]|nr:PKD domain-containing protein [Crocinitomicaceae bacterium]
MSPINEDFEQKLRDSFEHYELPYMPSSWASLERRLDKNIPRDKSRWVAGIAAVVLVAIGAGAFYYIYGRQATLASAGSKSVRFENIQHTTNLHEYQSEQGSDSISEPLMLNSPTLTKTEYTNTSAATPGLSGTGVAQRDAQVASVPSVPPSNFETKKSTELMLGVKTDAGVKPDRICTGIEVIFDVTNGPQEGSYLWNFGDGNFSNQPNPRHKYTKPGVYDVSISVTNKKDGHIQTKVMDDFITIHPSPTAKFEWQFINGALEEPTVKIINTSDNASKYLWKFEDGSTSKAISPVRSYSDKGKQIIALEVSNEYGCTDKEMKVITINKDYNLMAPERFSASKETFMPEGLKQGKLDFRLTIYNGEKAIFDTTNNNKGWDGTLPDGSVAAPGSQYPWIVIISNETTKEEKYFSGLVTVNP